MNNNPFHDLNNGLKATQREFRLQAACVDHLRSAFPGLLFFHIPNRPGSAKDGYMKKVMGAVAGAPDLVITWTDRPSAKQAPQVAAIELKAPGGTASSAQNKFLSSAAHRGWHTAICRSVSDLHTKLYGWGLKPVHDKIKEPDYRSENDKFADAFDAQAPL